MKKVLITGSNSYIGTSVEKFLLNTKNNYEIDTLDMKDSNWKEYDFSKYDVVFHVAGIAHIKETKRNKDLYYKVNRDLAYEVALKAKKSKIKQFIFLSSMSVYGMDTGVITKETLPRPKSAYGKSKYEAEQLIKELESKDFIISILRPPMVYGPNCPGNYARLEKLALKLPFYPKINNQRSMIHIDVLSEYIDYLIVGLNHGLFFPQNKEYMNTTNLINEIRINNGKKVKSTRLFNIFVYVFMFVPQIKKMFGTLVYKIQDK